MLVVYYFGHPFLLYDKSLQSFITNYFNNNLCFLINTELCQLHRCFGYPSTKKLHKMLKHTRHKTNKKIINNFTK